MGKLNPRFFATQIEEISKIEKILFISLIFQICVTNKKFGDYFVIRIFV